MLTQYLDAAMKNARYEILEDSGEYYGEIALCRGVFATATTLEACRRELLATLEDWLLVRIHHHLSLPKIDDVELRVHLESAA